MANMLPESIEPYENISSKAYEHPADRAATAALKAVPMLDTVVRKLIEWQYERALRQLYLGNSLKVGEHQLPDLWAAHTGVCRVLDVDRPDLYLAYQVPGGAAAIGSTNPIIAFDSQLLQWQGPGEQRAVIAHELGHILSDHLVYTTALQILLSVTMPLPFFLGIPFRAVKAVLLEWFRAAELSCDRAATLAVRDPQIVCRTLMVMSAGMPADKLNLDAFMAQALEYESWDDPSDRVRRFFNEINQTHPYSVRRVSEIMNWVRSGEYDRIIRGEYRRRDDPTNVREEAGDAVNFYAERFRTIFRETGENLAKAGSQIGGVADQLADWLRTRSGPGSGGGGSGSGSGSGGGSAESGGSGGGSGESGGSGSGSGRGPGDSSGSGAGSGGGSGESSGSGSSDWSESSGRPGSDSPGGDVFGDELDDEA